MDRQKGVWITIICILVIGVSVTKLTSDFVASGTLETAAATNLENPAETSDTAQPLTEMASSVMGRAAGAPAAGRSGVSRSGDGRAADGQSDGDTNEKFAAAGAQTQAADMESALMEQAQIDDSEEETAAASQEMAGAPQAFAAMPETAVATKAASDTVKSPLEPAPGPGNYQAVQESASASDESGYTAEEYRKRLDQTAAQIAQYREVPNDSSANFAYVASEYEWDLWDSELNTLYGILRIRMTEEEAEALKQEELEWLKERDVAADRAAAKTNSQNSRNTAYLEASARKTRERCYELLESYPDVLERAPVDTSKITIKVEEAR